MFGINKEKKFWNWFDKNNSKYLFLNEVEEDIKERHMNEFLGQLHKYSKGLYFLIGGHQDNKKVELIITSDGIIEYFPKVEKLVNAAPKLHNWDIIAFKPPEGIDFITEIGGRKFDPKEIQFIPLETKADPKAIGIQVCYHDFSEEQKDLFLQGTFIMIDSMIGEKSCALDIDYLDVVRTPGNIEDIRTLQLIELSEHIRTKKNTPPRTRSQGG
jgi:hypothetical protein